jgi:hypothetical protein
VLTEKERQVLQEASKKEKLEILSLAAAEESSAHLFIPSLSRQVLWLLKV